MKILIVALALFFGVWAWKIRIYLKWERKKKENVRPFYRWDESVHREPEQIERRRQASEESFSIQYQDEECASVKNLKGHINHVNIFIKSPSKKG